LALGELRRLAGLVQTVLLVLHGAWVGYLLYRELAERLAKRRHFRLSCGYSRHSEQENNMNLTIEHEQESDGRWLAEVMELPGVLAYGESAQEAISRAEVLALRVIAERLEHNESRPVSINISVPIAA
jgi:predicted RNase H-like HicB family nuclease